MDISEVKVRKTMSEGRLRAIVSIIIDDAIAVHDIKLVQGDDRMFIAMPSRKEENGVFRDIIHPINADIRHKIEQTILTAYQEFISTQQ